MPEGPEVRRNADLLSRLLTHRLVSEVAATSGKLQRKGIPGLEGFEPGIVTQVVAHGKLIRVTFDHGGELTSTLGMSGWWYPSAEVAEETLEKAYVSGRLVPIRDVIQQALKHSRVSLNAVDGKQLAVFTDMRNFGNMEYWPTGFPEKELKRRIGLDLLNQLPHLPPTEAQSLLLDMKVKAKPALLKLRMGDLALEQSFIAGLGNIYRAETLWLAGIDPYVKFGDLPCNDWLLFCEIACGVLLNAYLTEGRMRYEPEFIERCTGKAWPFSWRKPISRHLAYGCAVDIFGRAMMRDDSFGRPLWRLA